MALAGPRNVALSVLALLTILILTTDSRPARLALADQGSGITEEPMACAGAVEDERWLILDCAPGWATDHDSIRIFLRDGVDESASWEENLDFENSVWIFDVGSRDQASLIIDFHREEQSLIADIYDDGNGDRQVRYVLESGQPVVRDNDGRWTVRVIAPDGWWTQDGEMNFNLDLLVDGPVRASFDTPVYFMAGSAGQLTQQAAAGELPYAWLPGLQEAVKNDGEIDAEVRVRDSDGDGRPDYEWRQIYLPFGDKGGYMRTPIMVNSEDDEVPITSYLFWPYLAPVPGPFVKGYNESQPPISVDWTLARVIQIDELVASRGNPGNYFVYSINRIREGETTATNFESPFTFYDLAGAADGYPDTIVRVERYLSNDPFLQAGFDQRSLGRFPQPLVNIRYSWDQDHDHDWDYNVALLGRHPVDSEVRFPEFALEITPYPDAPYWVTEKAWDAAVFTAVERSGYWTSEGVYVGGVGGLTRYVTGYQTDPPTDTYSEIEVGFRSEYNFELQAQPYLYFSPIDSKLHLLGAQRGIWNIDGSSTIEYENLDGDDYIDRWIHRDADGAALRQLVAFQDLLLYADDERVMLLQEDIPPSEFVVLPPRDSDEWSSLGDDLASRQSDLAPTDFASMLQRFSHAMTEIEGASIDDLRLQDGQLRFILSLSSEFKAISADDTLALGDLEPGRYLVTYGDTSTVEETTPPELALVEGSFSATPVRPTELSPAAIVARVRNEGLETADDVPFALTAEEDGGTSVLIKEGVVTIFGGDTVQIDATWTPPGTGLWRVHLAVGPAPDVPLLETSVLVDVERAPGRSVEELLTITGTDLGSTTMLALLVAFGLVLVTLATGAVMMIWRGWD